MQPEAIYALLKELAATEPDFSLSTKERAIWLGRLHNVVEEVSGPSESIGLKVAGDHLYGTLIPRNSEAIRNTLYRALAKVEAMLPEAAQGGFIAAGSAFDVLAVLGAVLESAKSRILVIDPYMAHEILTRYALMAPEGVQIDLLAEDSKVKASLKPAAEAWVSQYGSARPLRVRLVAAGLHDRLLFVDDSEAWDISQSLNAIATRSPATIAKSMPEQMEMKLGAYAPLFDNATPLL